MIFRSGYSTRIIKIIGKYCTVAHDDLSARRSRRIMKTYNLEFRLKLVSNLTVKCGELTSSEDFEVQYEVLANVSQ